MSERQSPEEIARECCLASLHGPSDLYCCCREIAAAIRAERARIAALEAQCAAMRVCIHDLCGCHSEEIDECCQCIGEDACPCHAALSGTAGRELLEAVRDVILTTDAQDWEAWTAALARLRAALVEGV